MRRVSTCLITLVIVLLILAACQTPAGRSAGRVVDDATITTEVKAKLLHDSITKGIAVSVDTFQGAVTLTGAVETSQQRQRAAQIAESVRGVKKVNNLIELKK